MKKYVGKVLSIIAWSITIFSVPAYSGTQEGIITNILVRDSDGLHYFYVSGTQYDRPACSTGHTYWMIKDEASVAGRSQLAMILAAYMSKKTVRITGSNTCTRWGDGEDVNTIQLIQR
ncbi:MAG: hypothetical protein OEZ68_00665 [Gammaproteobacteria bacterium]|nr:hypothetical protein [Gammaproteobacteria bacterium]MDH5799290.1 hypothetical protein [Gammaproteobacteria bacterium]